MVTFTAPPTNPGEQSTLNFSLTQGYPVAITGTMTLTFAPDTGNPDNPQIQLASTTDRRDRGPRRPQPDLPPRREFNRDSGRYGPGRERLRNHYHHAATHRRRSERHAHQCRSGHDRCPARRSYDQRFIVQYLRQYAHRAGDRILHDSRDSIRDLYLYPRQRSIAEPEDHHRPGHTLFTTWYTTTGSAQYGSAFTYTQLFTLSGNASAVAGVGATLTNSVGTSTEATAP